MHTKLTNGIEDLKITYKNQLNITDEDTVIRCKREIYNKLIESRKSWYGSKNY